MEEAEKLVLSQRSELLFSADDDGKLTLPTGVPAGITLDGEEYEFTIGEGANCKAAHATGQAPQGYLWSGLREAFPRLTHADYAAAAKGMELLFWDTQTQYCSKCGGRLRRNSPISKICPDCGREIWPQMTPAVIVLIRRGREALLVHARNFRRPFFGLVAGFVETGESLEECVAREVREETSLTVRNVRYFGSQSWPFPSQLMIGFTADYEDGELRFADGELTEGGFFTPETLPQIPTPPSIARRLIEAWLAQQS